MNHLSADELIDALEVELAPRVATHLAACDRCRRQADDLRATMAVVRGVDVPEPSPWFWSRFLARVGDAVSAETAGCSAWWRQPWVRSRWTWSLACVSVVVLALAGSVVLRRAPGAASGPGGVAGIEDVAIDRSALPADVLALDDDAPWRLVADVSEDVDWDAVLAAGFGSALGSAERAVSLLSDNERSELARLLKAELEGSSL